MQQFKAITGFDGGDLEAVAMTDLAELEVEQQLGEPEDGTLATRDGDGAVRFRMTVDYRCPEAEANAALARAAKTETENEMLRRQEAERTAREARKTAEKAQATAADATNALEKGRLVGAVVRAANAEFGDLFLALKENRALGLPPEEPEKPEIKGLRARFRFDRVAAAAPDPDQLETALARNPDNSEARYQLAAHKVMRNDFKGALELLLTLLKQDRQYDDEAARKGMLSVFEILGGSGELVNRYRNRMFNALH